MFPVAVSGHLPPGFNLDRSPHRRDPASAVFGVCSHYTQPRELRIRDTVWIPYEMLCLAPAKQLRRICSSPTTARITYTIRPCHPNQTPFPTRCDCRMNSCDEVDDDGHANTVIAGARIRLAIGRVTREQAKRSDQSVLRGKGLDRPGPRITRWMSAPKARSNQRRRIPT